ncbi:M23 family metallopeptidase [Caballeronia ptereochthonis]|uniref:Peptidase M23B n=1 Tax=Caballeronia ptereochthonis TaxID=1777144 RepID=A0A158D2H5_9BURK|nr:M23 family metallopeptidase [Caballeronia ptereochthonis]SAK88812.1 peptidase M23B [Caballeronia ptereochthonis]
MSRQRIRFVEARTARAIAIIGGAALLIAALALGIAIGTVFARSHLGEEQALVSRRSYEIEELGRLNAALIELRPRVEALSAKVEELHDFDVHLKTAHGVGGASNVHDVPPLPDSEEPATALDGAGGPALPPRLCENARADGGTPRQRLKGTQQIIDCLNGVVSQLQTRTLTHYAAYMAFPGRDPSPGARSGSPYGNRFDPFTGRLSFHPGIDLVAPAGAPILASAGGRVVQAGERNGYGNAVDIRHSDGMMTRYGHASRIFVHAGDYVMPGQEIAEVGSTGRSTGPHLHFEVIVGGAQINPSPYLALFKRKPNAQG